MIMVLAILILVVLQVLEKFNKPHLPTLPDINSEDEYTEVGTANKDSASLPEKSKIQIPWDMGIISDFRSGLNKKYQKEWQILMMIDRAD